MKTILPDCWQVILGFIDSGAMFKAMYFTCKMFRSILDRDYDSYLDRFCDARLTIYMDTGYKVDHPLDTSVIIRNLKLFFTEKDVSRIDWTNVSILESPEVTPDMAEKYVGGEHIGGLAGNKNLTPEFVKKYAKYFRMNPILAQQPWMTIEFMEEIDYWSEYRPLSQHYPLDYFRQNYYDLHPDTYLYFPADKVLTIMRSKRAGVLEHWGSVVFEDSPLLSLEEILEQSPDHLDFGSVTGHPDMSWDYVIDHPDVLWEYFELAHGMPHELTHEQFHLLKKMDGFVRGYSSSSRIDLSIVAANIDANWNWKAIAHSAPISQITKHSHLPLSLDRVICHRSEIYFRDMEDHLHLPWDWTELSRIIVVTTKEFFETDIKKYLVMDYFIKNRRITLPVYRWCKEHLST